MSFIEVCSFFPLINIERNTNTQQVRVRLGTNVEMIADIPLYIQTHKTDVNKSDRIALTIR